MTIFTKHPLIPLHQLGKADIISNKLAYYYFCYKIPFDSGKNHIKTDVVESKRVPKRCFLSSIIPNFALSFSAEQFIVLLYTKEAKDLACMIMAMRAKRSTVTGT